MRKIILHCGLAPGDIVMMTAAVRDLHYYYPNDFITDVRTFCPDFWKHNPYITKIDDDEPGAEHVECEPTLINQADSVPYHCLHGFIDFFNSKFGLSIRPTVFRGDIHLSEQDKAWWSQVREVTEIDIPFWIIAAGGKYDITVKWWDTARYQEVVNRLKGKVQFVQVGGYGDHHPRLDGVIDFRGQTNLRELVRLVYHSQGVLCAPTALMHLAAAVEGKLGNSPLRACVVVAGGREPVHWEQYPGHQYLHTIGALPCCADGGCWKGRVFPLRDGDPGDEPDKRCTNVVGRIPKCLDMITAEAVVGRIQTYFEGGSLHYLSAEECTAAATGVAATAKNWYEDEPLNYSSAGTACDAAASRSLPAMPPSEGRGIVICGGGVRYFTCAWVCINMLRQLGCKLPVEVWHLGRSEMSKAMTRLLEPLSATTVDAFKVRKRNPVRILEGWELKAYSILHSRFHDVMLLDADIVPVIDPEFLFDSDEFKETGAMFWPDYNKTTENDAAKMWHSCGLSRPDEQEFETGQMLVDKRRCWQALNLTMWFNEHSDFYYRHIYGDKETFHLAFQKAAKSYHLIQHPIVPLEGTMCQHDPQGRRLFQHRNRAKWDLVKNRRIGGFWLEEECLDYVQSLKEQWNGHLSANGRLGLDFDRNGSPPPRIAVVIVRGNEAELRRTRENLACTDWNGSPVHAMCGAVDGPNPLKALFDEALSGPVDFLLLLQGELIFNRHLFHNLSHWKPTRSRQAAISSLYNPDVAEFACDFKNNARVTRRFKPPGKEAILLSAEAARFLRSRAGFIKKPDDLNLTVLARKLKQPVVFHAPSLVQRGDMNATSEFDPAFDFDLDWRA
jgi:ADP-heptose:LPS heptosyltransferase